MQQETATLSTNNDDTYHWRLFSVKQLEQKFEVFSVDAVTCNQQKEFKHQLSHHFTRAYRKLKVWIWQCLLEISTNNRYNVLYCYCDTTVIKLSYTQCFSACVDSQLCTEMTTFTYGLNYAAVCHKTVGQQYPTYASKTNPDRNLQLKRATFWTRTTEMSTFSTQITQKVNNVKWLIDWLSKA